MKKELPKVYDPQAVESSIYQMWMDGKCFHSEPDDSRKPFTIVMPPPNVTGQLHMGHAMDSTLQDILIRFKRMQGYADVYKRQADSRDEFLPSLYLHLFLHGGSFRKRN